MKKRVIMLMCIVLLCCCSGCSEEELERDTFQELKQGIETEMETVKAGEYENLTISCKNVYLPNNEEIQSVCFPVYTFTEKMNLEEKLNFYKDIIFPKLYDVHAVDGNHIVDLNSRVYSENEEVGRTYTYNYNYMIEHAEELKESVKIGYSNEEKYQFMETIPEGVCLNISQGVLGTLDKNSSPFTASDFEIVKVYNCYLDDLSDSYLLMDGEKTVAEAKAEIEDYLNSHYPLVGEENGIKNQVYQISVCKIPNTEYHVFNALRTLTYNGIRVKEEANVTLSSEVGVMGQAFLCESNKVDITLGFINCFAKGSVIKTYEEILPFTHVMQNLSYYLTGDTIFDIGYIGLEYRMFTEVVEDITYYNWIPYWSFLAKNPNNDSVIRIYMNIETGEMESYEI